MEENSAGLPSPGSPSDGSFEFVGRMSPEHYGTPRGDGCDEAQSRSERLEEVLSPLSVPPAAAAGSESLLILDGAPAIALLEPPSPLVPVPGDVLRQELLLSAGGDDDVDSSAISLRDVPLADDASDGDDTAHSSLHSAPAAEAPALFSAEVDVLDENEHLESPDTILKVRVVVAEHPA